MSLNHAKAYANEYRKRIWWAFRDTGHYIIPAAVYDAASVITDTVDPKHKYTRSRSELEEDRKEGIENVRKWFKMVKDWAKSAAKKAKDYLNWDSSSASSTVHHMRARAKFKWKK